DDPAHPLLQLLRVPFDGATVGANVKQASAEDWQREAARLEAHGKLEQVEAIRSQVLRTQPTPWKQLDGEALGDLYARALDPKGVSSKAREQLLDVLSLHPDLFASMLLAGTGHRPLVTQRQQAPATARRLLAPWSGKKFKDVLENTEKYGLEHRSMQGLTPLMSAARAGNLPLVEALLSRGASRTTRDAFGLQALHHALRRVEDERAFASAELAAMWELLAPPSFDVQVEGRLVQVGREQGEYVVFQLLVERLHESGFTVEGTPVGVGTSQLLTYVDALPETVIRDFRKKRPYLSSILSKNEANSPTAGSRQLFERRERGRYVVNSKALLWRDVPGSEGLWEPADTVLAMALRAEPARRYAARHRR
ncbi:MAG: ankyrin repeat domain-containing protein, partial [Archangium sp.]